jgi:hypothetical protein
LFAFNVVCEARGAVAFFIKTPSTLMQVGGQLE